jgi:hypothetical protein
VNRTPLQATESQMQATLIAWCRAQRDGRRFAIHCPNEGKRSPRRGAQLKIEGMTPGVSDVFIPMAVAGWHGYWLELKAHGKKPSTSQIQFLADMDGQGYATGWTDNLDAAMSMLTAYATGRLIRPNWVHYEAPASLDSSILNKTSTSVMSRR